MTTFTLMGRTRTELAARVALDIQEGWYVNLGIGAPEQVANFIDPHTEVILHSENGILGMGGSAPADEVDWDLINAGKRPIQLLQGGVFFDHVTSFSMMRGGHLDLCILGAFQVSAQGDLANWWTGNPDELPAVGGAMDLVAGARRVFVMMDHVTKDGQPKIVQTCQYPLTGLQAVHRMYTDLAVIDVTEQGLEVREYVDTVTFEQLQLLTEAPLRRAQDCRVVALPARGQP